MSKTIKQAELPVRALYSVWHKDYPEHASTYDGKSASDARYSCYLEVSDTWNEVRYVDFRCRKISPPAPIERDGDRLAKANAIIKTFIPHASLAFTNEGVLVKWETSYERQARLWITHGNDFYPIWHKRAPWGGTCSTALSQVIRWLENKPVFPMGTWRHWAGPEVRLGRDYPGEVMMLAALEVAEWPEKVLCVVCGQPPKGLDWWSLDNLSGPCCWGVPEQCAGRNGREWDYHKGEWIS